MKTTSELPKKLPVGIWIRVSTDDQAQGDSPEHHRIRAQSYAETKGWEVRELYDLAGVSGKSVKDHRAAPGASADSETRLRTFHAAPAQRCRRPDSQRIRLPHARGWKMV